MEGLIIAATAIAGMCGTFCAGVYYAAGKEGTPRQILRRFLVGTPEERAASEANYKRLNEEVLARKAAKRAAKGK